MVEASLTEEGRYHHSPLQKTVAENRNRERFELTMSTEKYLERFKLFQDQTALKIFILERMRGERFGYYSIALTKPNTRRISL